MMIHNIELDENDIIKVIANAFMVDQDKVMLIHYIDTEGYGINEHNTDKVKIKIKLNEGIKI